MSKASKFIQEATAEKVRSRGLIKKVAIEAVNIARSETISKAVEVHKRTCPSRSSRGCNSYIHRRETKNTKCDGNCARVKYFINGLNKLEA